jgi:hypothetical protein
MNVTLHATPNRVAIAESYATFQVKGKGVHNREFQHRVVKFAKEGLILVAQPSVISSHRVPTKDFQAGTIEIGDTLTVDGKDYIVTARPLANPRLVEVERPGTVQVLRCANGEHVYERAAVRGRPPTSCTKHGGTGVAVRNYRTGSQVGEKAFTKHGGTVRSHRYEH